MKDDVRIDVVLGDITKLDVDAMVNPANTKLVMGGGVAGAIKRAGGKEIEDEAVRKGPIKIGEAVETKAGRLKARYVIHAPTMDLSFKTDEEKIRLAVKAALKKAKDLGVKSLAIPGMGTGVGGFPEEKAAGIIVEEIMKEKPSFGITLVDMNKRMVNAFKQALSELKRKVNEYEDKSQSNF